MFFLPDGISGLPMPRYFENALLLLTGRTRTPFSSLSNSSLSPLRTPSARRTSRGTVICPLLVILACFCIVTSRSLLYYRILTLARAGSLQSNSLSQPMFFIIFHTFDFTRMTTMRLHFPSGKAWNQGSIRRRLNSVRGSPDDKGNLLRVTFRSYLRLA